MQQRGFAHILLLLVLIIAAGVAAFFIFNLSEKFFPKVSTSSVRPATQINPAADTRSTGAAALPAASGAGGGSQFVNTQPSTGGGGETPSNLQLSDPDKWPG